MTGNECRNWKASQLKTCTFCWPQTVCCCKGYDLVLCSFSYQCLKFNACLCSFPYVILLLC